MYGGGAVDSGGGGGGNTGGGTLRAYFRSTVKECGMMKGRRFPRWVVS